MNLSLVLLLAWLYSATARPQNQNSQDFYDGCQPTNWRYRRDARYVYKYVGLTSTGVVGTSDDMAEIKIEALCEVIPVRTCAYILKVSEVSLLERSSKEAKFMLSKGSKEFAGALTRSHVTFTLTDGRVVEIKSTAQEPAFVTNVKRGILSAMQLEYKDEDDTTFMERDISGDCPTQYVKGYREITKVKNLMECSNRSRIDFMLKPVLYSSSSTRKTLLDCTSSCHYSFDRLSDDIKSVECKETHLFRPFSHQSAGVMTSVMQNLTLLKTYKVGVDSWNEDSDRKSSDLRFDFNSMSKHQSQVPKDLVYKTLNDLIRNSPFKEISMKSALLYTKLVYQLQHLNEKELESVWMKYHDCVVGSSLACRTETEREKYRQMLVDSFSQCGTDECAKFILDLVRRYSSSVKPEEMSLVKQLLPEMAWIRKPTERVINMFMEILMDKRNSLPKHTITTFGSMVRSFCDNNKCTLNDNFDDWMRFLVDHLSIYNKMNCVTTPENVDDVIFTFKALKDIAQLTSSSNAILKSCAGYSNYRNVSVAALEALRNVQQDKELKSFLGAIYEDYSRDPEIRMVAYLAMIKNPSENDIIFALKTLEKEINTQVGSFVWSHLHEMNNSVEPTHGKRVAGIIKSVTGRLEKYRRFFNTTQKSRFWQKSMFNEKWNLGMSAESYLIYHPESYLPRSSYFNLTMDILGGAFPLLESNVRTEGFEKLWQTLFGPEGFSNDINEINANKQGRDIELDHLDNKINMPKPSPSGFSSIKFLGKELFRPEDLKWLHMDPSTFMVEMKKLSKGMDKTYTKNFMFAQESLVVPTCIGLPLDLSLNGTAVGSAQVTLKADLWSVMTKMLMGKMYWGKMDVFGKGVLKPSAVVSMTGRMSVDAMHSKTGVQLDTSMFTSTELTANLIYKEGQPIRFHFNVSEKPQEIFNMSSSLMRQMNDEKTPMGVKKRSRIRQMCTSSVFNSSRYLGLDWCLNVSVPLHWHNKTLPLFPLTGPGNFSMKMIRVDPKLTTYTMEYAFKMQNETIIKTGMQFSTPRATFERIVQLNLTSMTKSNKQLWDFTVGNKHRNWFMGLYQRAPNYKKAMIKFNVTLGKNSLNHMIQMSSQGDAGAFVSNMSMSCDKTGRPITVMFLNGTYGYLDNSMNGVFNLTHHPAKFTWQVEAAHSLKMMSTNISCIAKCGLVPHSPLLNHNMKINVTYVKKTQDKQMRLNLKVNSKNKVWLFISKRHVSMKPYKKMVNYFSNITMYNRTTLLSLTMAEQPRTTWNHLNLTHQKHSLSFNTTWFLYDTSKKMSLNVTYMNSANINHSILLTTMMKNRDFMRNICWNGTYMNRTFQNTPLFNSCLVYLNKTGYQSISWNLTAFNRTHKLNSTWLPMVKSNIKGIIKLNYTCQDKTLANITAWYWKIRNAKNLYLIGKISNWTLDLKHQYLSSSNFGPPLHNRTFVIAHKITNTTHVLLNNTIVASFVNYSTMVKGMSLKMTLWNETYGVRAIYNRTGIEEPKHIHKIRVYSPMNDVSWDIMLKNATKFLNFSNVVRYQDRTVLNHSVFWRRESRVWNVTMEFLTNATFSLNSSGTIETGINISSNFAMYNKTMFMWKCFANGGEMSGKLTGWNRTTTLRRTMNWDSISLKLRTWHHIKKDKFNGSLSWMLDRSIRKFELNMTLPSTSLYLTSFSLNTSHFNMSIMRRNGSQFYKEAIIRLLPKGKLHREFNMTSLQTVWKVLNIKTFHLPAKLVNITLNSTSGGINMSRTGKHLKMILRNITHVITTWNFTKQNLPMNFFNLSMKLMNVTSMSLPHVAANYSFYIKGNKVDMEKVLKNLSTAFINFTKSKIDPMEIVDELIWSYRNISGSFNDTAVFRNLTEMITNTTWYKKYWKNVLLAMKYKGVNLAAFGRHQARILELAKMIGEWKLMNTKHSKDINAILKEYIPHIQNYSLYLMNETKKCAPSLHEITLTFRNMTYISEYLIDISYPNIHKWARSLLMNMNDHLTEESWLGGMVHPSWLDVMHIFNISIFNTTMRNIHEYAVCGTHLETVFPILHQPEYIMEHFHKFKSHKKLDQIMDGLLNKTLELYNMTMRLPSWYMNNTHDKMVYFTDFLVVMFNDSANLMEYASKKNLPEIVTMYMNHTLRIARMTWNTTKKLLYSNWSEPLEKIWEMAKVEEIFSDDALKTMPWMRPTFRLWNTTAQQLKKYTAEVHLKKYVPLITKMPIEKSRMLSHYIDSCLKVIPGVNITFNNIVLNVISSSPFSPQMPPNFNQAFLDMYTYYQSFSRALIQFPKMSSQWFNKMIDHLVKSRYNMNQTIMDFLDRAEMAFDWDERFVDGSLINETVHKIWKMSDEHWPMMMNMDMVHYVKIYTTWLLQKTLLNMTKIPLYNTWKMMTDDYQMQVRNLTMFFIPKNSMAFVIDQRHVITFDKRVFQFPKYPQPECTYVIARDFLEEDFTVLSTPISYLIITPYVKIEIFQNGKVRAHEVLSSQWYTDLPLQFQDVYAIREGPFVRVIHRMKWFEFEFDVERSTFGAYISGFYHNRTMGILGSNNGEMSDDWRSPLGKNRTKVEKFFNSWLIRLNQKQCYMTAQPPLPRCTRSKLSRCHELFDSKFSPFKSCFDSVSPRMFLETCLHDRGCDPSERPSYMIPTSHCNISAAYIRACAQEKVSLAMPKDCESCSNAWSFSSNIDIVFITSEGTKMSSLSPKLKPFVNMLNSRLVDKHFTPRYGLVGFSGNPPAHWKGHVHTLNGQYFGSSKDLEKAVDTLNFAPLYLKTNVSDGYSGILEATKYPFRPGTKVMFILLTDSPRVGDGDLSTEDVSNAMKEINANLIIIGDYTFKKDLIGGDTDDYRYYLRKHKGIKSKHSERLPKTDDYVKVMYETKGAVFRVKKFEDDLLNKWVFDTISGVVLKFSECRKVCRQYCKTGQFDKTRYVCDGPRMRCYRP